MGKYLRISSYIRKPFLKWCDWLLGYSRKEHVIIPLAEGANFTLLIFAIRYKLLLLYLSSYFLPSLILLSSCRIF
jgi:hypothetical protein